MNLFLQSIAFASRGKAVPKLVQITKVSITEKNQIYRMQLS